MESWVSAEDAGSKWPLAVADFYLQHTIILGPGEFEPHFEPQVEPEEQDQDQAGLEEDEGGVEELILDLFKLGEELLQAGFKVVRVIRDT